MSGAHNDGLLPGGKNGSTRYPSQAAQRLRRGAEAQVTQINGGGSELAARVYQSIFSNLNEQVDPTVNFNYRYTSDYPNGYQHYPYRPPYYGGADWWVGGAEESPARSNDWWQIVLLPDHENTLYGLSQAPLPTGWALQVGTNYVPVIANPRNGGYPIVQYTTSILPTCSQDNNVVNGIIEFLYLIFTEPDYISLIEQQGFVELPEPLVAIANDNILNNDHGYNIDIQEPTICQAGGDNVLGYGTYPSR